MKRKATQELVTHNNKRTRTESFLSRLPCGILSTYVLPYLTETDLYLLFELPIEEIKEFVGSVNWFNPHKIIPSDKKFIQNAHDVESLDEIKSLPRLRKLVFTPVFNNEVTDELRSVDLRELTFSYFFDQDIAQLQLPLTLRKLTFGDAFNHPVDDLKLPPGLTHLTLGEEFNSTIQNLSLPRDLETLTFGEEFNTSLDGVVFPAGLKKLTFGLKFNTSLDEVKFPDGLEDIIFGNELAIPLNAVQFPPGTRIQVSMHYPHPAGAQVTRVID